jgi:HEAT repeat protein
MTETIELALRSADEDVRLQTVLAFGTPTTLADLGTLVEMLADRSWRVRKAVVRVLAQADIQQIVPLLVQALSSSQKNIQTVRFQNSAIECLALIGPAAIPGIGVALHDPDKDVRISAANALGAIHHHDACEALIAALGDEHVNVRYAAVEALSKIPDQKSVLPLTRILDGQEEWLKLPAISALGNIGDYRATPFLLKIAPQPLYQQTVIEALGHIGDERGIPCILESLNSTDREIRKTAVLSMERLSQKLDKFHLIIEHPSTYRQVFRSVCNEQTITSLIEFTQDKDNEVVAAAIKLLGWSGRPDAATVLLDKLGEEQFLEIVVNALIQIGADAIPALAQGYAATENLERRLLIVDCLRELGGEPAVELLLQYLSASHDDLLTYALLKALNEPLLTACLLTDREHQSSRYFERVVIHAKNGLKSFDPLVRAEAVYLWGQLFGIQVLEDIFTATKDPEPTVRVKAIAHLGYFAKGNQDLTQHLIILLSDDHPNIRKQAAIALGNAESAAAFPALLLVLDDANAMVRRAAVTGLGMYLAHHAASQYQQEVLERMADVLINRCRRYEDGLLKIEICTTLQHIPSEQSLELLLQLTTDLDFDVRKSSILTLGRFTFAKARVVPLLISFLGDTHWSVREAAITALGALEAKEAEPQLLQMLAEADLVVQRATFIALGRIGSVSAIPVLIEHLAHEELDYAAYQALALLATQQPECLQSYVTHQNPKIHLFLQHLLEGKTV